MIITLDPGHLRCIDGKYLLRGKQSPQVPPGIYEGEFNWTVANHCRRALEAAGHAVRFAYGEEQKTNPSLKSRVKVAQGSDVFVSIHANAAAAPGWSAARGFVIFSNTLGFALGTAVHAQLSKLGDVIPSRYPRPRKHNNLYVLSRPQVPAVLIECGFMTNRDDVEFLSTMHGQGTLGRLIADGVNAWAH